jgi:hypothetical protein
MRIFGYHVPGTRDLQKEVEQLQKQIELLQKERELSTEVSNNLRAQNHQLRMDLGKAHKTLDEWMGHYDALRRDMQHRLEQSVQIKLKLEEKGEHLDPVAQMRELRELVRHQGKGHSQEPPQHGELVSEGRQREQKAKKEQARGSDRGMAVSP